MLKRGTPVVAGDLELCDLYNGILVEDWDERTGSSRSSRSRRLSNTRSRRLSSGLKTQTITRRSGRGKAIDSLLFRYAQRRKRRKITRIHSGGRGCSPINMQSSTGARTAWRSSRGMLKEYMIGGAQPPIIKGIFRWLSIMCSEREAFYDWLSFNTLSPTAQSLWNALFTIYNQKGWPGRVCESAGHGDSLLYARFPRCAPRCEDACLKNKGLLDFTKGERRASAAAYKLIFFTAESEVCTEKAYKAAWTIQRVNRRTK